MPSLGPSVPLAFWLWLLPTCLPASGGEWAGLQSDSSPLVKPSPLFCERVWQCLRLELFTGKFSLSLFFFSPPPPSGYPTVWVANESVTGRKARGLQMEEIGCKCQTFLSLLSGRRKQTGDIFFPSLYKFKRKFLLKCCVAMTPGFT